jgi:hypothetical protein
LRERTHRLFHLPEDESLEIELVSGKALVCGSPPITGGFADESP